jgi:hypothetical protein
MLLGGKVGKLLGRDLYAFSKKWDNLKAALALHFAYYNFCRVHSSLRVTPAMEAGIEDHVWNIADRDCPVIRRK